MLLYQALDGKTRDGLAYGRGVFVSRKVLSEALGAAAHLVRAVAREFGIELKNLLGTKRAQAGGDFVDPFFERKIAGWRREIIHRFHQKLFIGEPRPDIK